MCRPGWVEIHDFPAYVDILCAANDTIVTSGCLDDAPGDSADGNGCMLMWLSFPNRRIARYRYLEQKREAEKNLLLNKEEKAETNLMADSRQSIRLAERNLTDAWGKGCVGRDSQVQR